MNGTKDILPRYTSTNGFINLTHIPAGNLSFTILWKDVMVGQTTVYVDSDGPYLIKTQVYQLTVQVFGNNGVPINGAYVIVYTESGIGYGLDITDAAGEALFKLPIGNYQIDAHYTSDFWLSVVKASASESVSVTESSSKDIILASFPPVIWSTIGFALIVIIVAVAAATFLMLYIKSKRNVPKRTPKKKISKKKLIDNLHSL